jgi:AcrR family transcriptional regulator
MAKLMDKRRAVMDEMMRDTVYEAAIEVLLEHGIAALTMERLAKTAGVSRATLYNYFRDRDDVLVYIGDRIVGPLMEAVVGIADGDLDPQDKLAKIGEAVLRYVDENRSIILSIYDRETAEGSRREAQKRRREAFRALIGGVIREGIESGQFRKVDVARASDIYLGALEGIVDAMVDRSEFLPPEETFPHLASIILRGLEP